MRTCLVIAAVLLAPGVSQAQEEAEQPVAPEGQLRPPPSSDDPAPLRTPPPSREQGRDSSSARHTVEQGDTLWDLSQKYLGSPWYWPKVWSYNPDIANPHWIYPGNVVRFSQGGEEAPALVEVGQEPVTQTSLDDVDPRVQVMGKIGFTGKPAQAVMLPGFVTPAEVEETGTVAGSYSETFMLATGDKLLLTFRKGAPRIGEQYVVFRRQQELIHPISGRSVGFYTKIIGEARVERVENGTAVAALGRVSEPVHRGDLIGPAGEPLLLQVAARPSDREVKGGMLIAGTNTYVSLIGEHMLAVVDLGSEAGVQPGNVFTLWRKHDPATIVASNNPTEIQEWVPKLDVGECIAVDVKSKATVCLVSRSMRDLVPGDHAEIRPLGNAIR